MKRVTIPTCNAGWPVLLLLVATAFLFRWQLTSDPISTEPTTVTSSYQDEPQQQSFQPIAGQDLQLHLDQTVAKLKGKYSLVVYDPVYEQSLATINPSDIYFSASLYKLYLAFLVWQDVDQGIINIDDSLVDHPDFGILSTITCLDLMIRLSDSPCAEAFLETYDYDQLQARLKHFGLPDIDMPNFKVSSLDMLEILRLIESEQALSAMATNSLFESMGLQVYHQGLRQAFASSESTIVYDKVGFSQRDWHDVGLIKVGQLSRPIIVVILSLDAGERGVGALSSSLSQWLLDNIPNN